MNRIVKYQNPVSTLVGDMFDSFWGPLAGARPQSGYLQERVTRNDDGYTVELVVPGISRDELNVEYRSEVLQVSHKDRYLCSYRLPAEANVDGITAELQNGILTLKVPLNTPPVVKIEIKNGS